MGPPPPGHLVTSTEMLEQFREILLDQMGMNGKELVPGEYMRELLTTQVLMLSTHSVPLLYLVAVHLH